MQRTHVGSSTWLCLGSFEAPLLPKSNEIMASVEDGLHRYCRGITHSGTRSTQSAIQMRAQKRRTPPADAAVAKPRGAVPSLPMLRPNVVRKMALMIALAVN